MEEILHQLIASLSQVVQDFFHQQYVNYSWFNTMLPKNWRKDEVLNWLAGNQNSAINTTYVWMLLLPVT